MKLQIIVALFIGWELNLFLGEPVVWLRPSRFLADLIRECERTLRALFPKTPDGLKTGGICMTLLVLLFSAGVPALLLYIASRLSGILLMLLMGFMDYQLLSASMVKARSMKVHHNLAKNDREGAEKAASLLTEKAESGFEPKNILMNTVEYVAIHTSDKVVASMIYLVIGGPVLGSIYKAADLMDSLLASRDEFGWFSSRLSYILKWIPARLTALLMILAAKLLGMDGAGAGMVWKRDRKNWKDTASSAQMLSACAGALGVVLEKKIVSEKSAAPEKGALPDNSVKTPEIQIVRAGNDTRPLDMADIVRANQLFMQTAWLALSICLLIRLIL